MCTYLEAEMLPTMKYEETMNALAGYWVEGIVNQYYVCCRHLTAWLECTDQRVRSSPECQYFVSETIPAAFPPGGFHQVGEAELAGCTS